MMQIEIKLNDRTYREKYNYVIDELECRFIHYYCSELQKQSNYTMDEHSSFYYALIAYFQRYCKIIKHVIPKSTSANDVYLFIENHRKYCFAFATQLREFGKWKKALQALELFTTYIDAHFHLVLKSVDHSILMTIDIMLGLGLFQQCKAFITRLMDKIIEHDPNSNGQFRLTLVCVICRMHAEIRLTQSCLCQTPLETKNEILSIQSTIYHLQKLHKKQEWNGKKSHTYYYSQLCLLYLQIVKSATIDSMEQQINRIKYIIHRRLRSRIIFPCHFAEGCFMLAVIYQHKMKQIKSAAFLYYLSIIRIFDAIDFGADPYMFANAPVCHTNILAYFNLSICLYELNQYQLSLKLLKRILKFSTEMNILPMIHQQMKLVAKTLEIDVKCNYCYKNQSECIKLKSCKGCASVFYCSIDCQKRDWKSSHRLSCSKYWLNKSSFINSRSINMLISDYFRREE
eukprot:89777_1